MTTESPASWLSTPAWARLAASEDITPREFLALRAASPRLPLRLAACGHLVLGHGADDYAACPECAKNGWQRPLSPAEQAEKEKRDAALDLLRAREALRGRAKYHLQLIRWADEGCDLCAKHVAAIHKGETFFAPNHTASAYCRSGQRAHCTCDTCF